MALEGKDQTSRVREAMAEAQSAQGRDDRQKQQDEVRGENRRDESRRREGNTRYASLTSIGRLNPTPIAMSNTAEALEQFRRDFVEAMPAKDDNNLITASVFPIDAATAGLPFSLVVVAGTKRGKESLGVGYHTFILAASADPLRPREESFRGQRVFIVQVPGDGYDSRTRDVVKDALTQNYGNKNFYSADAEVVFEDFPSAKDDPSAIADCVKNAFAAIKTAIDRNDPDAAQLSLAAEDGDSYNTIHVQHRQNHVYDRGHMPTRADVIIDLQSREQRGRNSRDSIDQLVTGTRISRLGGFFDFVYAPAEGASARNELYRRSDRRTNDEEFQMYALRFIATFIDTIDFSPTTMMLGLATMNAMGESQEVMRAFEPNLNVGEDDMRNIGALAIEPNLEGLERGFGNRIETKTSAFTTAKRQALLRSVIRPGIIYSIDVPECGASSWQHIDLLAAAQGNAKAQRRLYDAARVLTDGHIEDFISPDEQIIDSHVERIHAGYYTEGNQRLDLRDFDYLALLNLLRPEKSEDLDVLLRWGMAATEKSDTILTQSERYEILKDFVPNAVITGYHQRFNITRAFNEALIEAIARCKLSLTPTSSDRIGGDRYRKTYGNIDQILQRAGSGSLYRNQRPGRDRFDDRYSDRSEERYSGRW